ncbi:hypothetical protein B0H13DRAFT_1061724 [Mycena leptocephala]|nr:hypothetical protein B0H13DRAFT_1061724 [Mycena leptocephala]
MRLDDRRMHWRWERQSVRRGEAGEGDEAPDMGRRTEMRRWRKTGARETSPGERSRRAQAHGAHPLFPHHPRVRIVSSTGALRAAVARARFWLAVAPPPSTLPRCTGYRVQEPSRTREVWRTRLLRSVSVVRSGATDECRVAGTVCALGMARG